MVVREEPMLALKTMVVREEPMLTKSLAIVLIQTIHPTTITQVSVEDQNMTRCRK